MARRSRSHQAGQQHLAKPSPRSQSTWVPKEVHNEFLQRKWALPARYQMKHLLGSGRYGTVSEAYDLESQKAVAIKQANHVFDDLLTARRALREVALLCQMNHPNICRIHDIVIPGPPWRAYDKADPFRFTEFYLVLELCDSDMQKLIRSGVDLNSDQVTLLLYNLLCGLNYLHSAGIWHRDLKPADILVNQDCSVKICDFGLSRTLAVGYSARTLTRQVATRWYRAPELTLLTAKYTEAVDVWSAGCIYAELLGMLPGSSINARRPLFPCQPTVASPALARPRFSAGEWSSSYYTDGTRCQLIVTIHLVGTPSEEDIRQFDQADVQDYLRCLPKHPGSRVGVQFAHAKKEEVHLLEQMILFAADQRIKVSEALNHPLFHKVRSRRRENKAEQPACLEFEQYANLDEMDIRRYFLQEATRFHPHLGEGNTLPSGELFRC